MPIARTIACFVLLFACGDDSVAGCPSPFVLTATGCELPDAGGDDANESDAVAIDARDTSDATILDATEPSDAAASDAPRVESCNGLDDDGDERIDEGLPEQTYYLDSDEDDYGSVDTPCVACGALACGMGVWVTDSSDCDDSCDRCFPGGSEVCDERNNDCDENVDEGVSRRYFEDLDRDGFGSEVFVDACSMPDGFAVDGGDCADMEPRAHPGAMTYRAEPMGNPPASGLAHDYDCDGSESYEILLEGNPGEVCGRPSCPDIDRWEIRPACGALGSVFRCLSIALNCRALDSSQELALCR